MNIQDCFPLGLTGLISLQSKGLSSLLLMTELFFLIIIAIIIPDFQGLILKVRRLFFCLDLPYTGCWYGYTLGQIWVQFQFIAGELPTFPEPQLPVPLLRNETE